ncbi:MAG TPA: sugar-binding protein [Spirochaetia bacterium]|nr:sugar-binding protein [Spirochaetia bacterium]
MAWNDTNLTQDSSAENWGILTLKPLPLVASVPKGTPKVDGNIDPLWNAVPALPLEVPSQGDAEVGSTVKLLWDEGHLYALYEVHDKVLNDKATNPWEQDSVELFLDQNNAKTAVYEADDGQYRVSFRNLATFNGGQKDGFHSATRLIPGGYRVVMAIPLYTVPGAEGNLLGFDAQVNNADASGSRVGIRNWADGSNMGYQDTSGWGLIRLVP